jgi:nucleoside-diphosphate-sugar epimerase
MANSLYRADFIYLNLQIQQNVIGESFRHGVKKLLFLGSTCIYPKDAPQPMTEEVLLTSPLEYTNEEYAISKIAGLKMCESFNFLADLIKKTIGYEGTICWDETKPDGTMRKLIDVSKLHQLGWHHQIEIEEGVRKLVDWYRKN